MHWKLTHPGVWRAKRHSLKLDIIFDAHERDAIMEQVHLRMSPKQLLYSRMKEVMRDGELSDEVLVDLFGCAGESTGTPEDQERNKSFQFAE